MQYQAELESTINDMVQKGRGVPAVTATANANSAANESTINVGYKLNGRARYVTQVITTSGSTAFLA